MADWVADRVREKHRENINVCWIVLWILSIQLCIYDDTRDKHRVSNNNNLCVVVKLGDENSHHDEC